MIYPRAQRKRLMNQIEKLQKQTKLLRAGAVEAVIAQNFQEIRQLQELLAVIRR